MSNPMPSFSRNRERLILLVLAVVQFTSIVDFMVVMPLEPELEGDLHLTPTRFGLIVSSYTFAAGLAGLLASMFVDRFARRTAFLAIYAGFLVGTFACGMAPDYGWLLAARVLTGAFGGVLGGMAFAIVGDVFPEERRGRATGAIMSGFALASVLGVPVGLTLGQIYGWHTPFRLLAVLGVPIFFIAAKVLPPLNAHMIAGPRTQSPLAHLKETFIDPNNLRAFALTISMMFGVFCVVPFLAPYLVSNVGIAKDHLWVVYTTGGVLTLIGSPIIGKLADRHGKLLVYRVIAPVLCVVVLVATNLPPVHLVIATLVMGGMMLCNGGPHGAGNGDDHLERRAEPPRRLPRSELGRAAHLRWPRLVGRRLHPHERRRRPSGALSDRRPHHRVRDAPQPVARGPATHRRCAAAPFERGRIALRGGAGDGRC